MKWNGIITEDGRVQATFALWVYNPCTVGSTGAKLYGRVFLKICNPLFGREEGEGEVGCLFQG